MWVNYKSGAKKSFANEEELRALRNALIFGAAQLLKHIENEDIDHVLNEVKKLIKEDRA